MKFLFSLLLLVTAQLAFCQSNVLQRASVQTKWIKPATYTMNWFLQTDTAVRTIGKVIVNIEVTNGKVLISQKVQLANNNNNWIDTTIADFPSLAPVYHSSYNMQRDMAINYGGSYISGYYNDRINQKQYAIADTLQQDYYDSNIYQNLLAWLPLSKGYTVNIPVYNYASDNDHQLKYVNVDAVTEENYQAENGTTYEVYKLTTSDNMSGLPGEVYIDKKTRNVLKIIAETKRGKMVMSREM